MKNQTLIMLVIAGACGLVVMLGVKQYLDKQSQKEEVPTMTALVAQTDIRPGEPMNALQLELREVEVGSAPETVVTSMDQIEERSLKVARSIGDWILVEHLSEKGHTGVHIPNGMRIATIDVDANLIHSGLLRPGNRIDVMVSYEERDNETRERMQTIAPVLQYVEVFAVGNQKYGVDPSAENDKARNISLLVTPEQVKKLEIAKGLGKISTSLRSMTDKEELDWKPFTEDDLVKGGEINEASARDIAAQFEQPGEESDNSNTVFDSLQMEVGDNGPQKDMMQPPPIQEPWVMAIYEAGQVRVEHVNEMDDTPVDTRGAAGIPVPSGPVGPAPSRGGGPAAGPPAGIDPDDVTEALEGLEELF